MDKKKTLRAIPWFTILCVVISALPGYAQRVADIRFGGHKTSNDSITLFLKFVDNEGKRITSLDPANIKSSLSILEDGKAIAWENAKIESVKSGKRIPADYTFSVLFDLNIPLEGKKQLLPALRKLVESAPDSCVYISFFGDNVGRSELITNRNFDSFEKSLMDRADKKLFYSAIYSKLVEFNPHGGAYEQELEGLSKNSGITSRAEAHPDKNILFIFTECGVDPVNEGNGITYLEVSEHQEDTTNIVPRVYAFYYTADGSINEGVESTMRAITQNEYLTDARRGQYEKSSNMDEVLALFTEVVEGQTYDYAFSYKAEEGKQYSADTKFLAKWDDAPLGKETVLSIGTPEKPWQPSGGNESIGQKLMRFLIALLVTLLTIAFFFLVMKVLIPIIKSKTFSAKYYKKYVPEANVNRRVCHYCKQDLTPGQMIVTKCNHVMHVHCWKTNNYKCSEYGQNCNTGIQEHVEWDSLLSPASLRDCKQTISGIIAGLVGWIAYVLMGQGSVFNKLSMLLVKMFYKPEGQPVNQLSACVDKMSAFLAIGLLLGFFLSLVFRYNDEYRDKDWKVYLKILGLSLLSGVIGMAAFAIGGSILCALLSALHPTNIPWYCSLPAYLLFSICMALSLTIKSSVPVKSAMLGGLCSAAIGFLVLYFADMSAPWMRMLLNFIIYGGGLGASLVTVRMLAEKYFLVIQNGIKAGQRIPIHKWMSATGGGNKVSIGMTGECEIQMNWEKSNKVAKEHAQLFIDPTRSVPMIKPLANGVVYNTRAELPVGKPSVLTNGDTFKIGDTIFQYVESD